MVTRLPASRPGVRRRRRAVCRARILELALQIPEVGECHRITGEDCFYLKLHLRSIDELASVLDRFLAYGDTTTSIINSSPIPYREPPIPDAA